MAARKRSLGASFGGLREATCKGNWPLKAYANQEGFMELIRVPKGAP